MTEPLLEIRELSLGSGERKALSDVSLTVEKGSYTVLLGPAGAGKTELLSVIGGFEAPTEGAVLFRGTDAASLPPAGRPTATVFGDRLLFPHMSACENVAFGLGAHGVGRRERRRRAREMLALLGLTAVADLAPHKLTVDQAQRVALARALATDSPLVLLDEPTAALDADERRQLQSELKALQRRTGAAFIHATADRDEAMALADHCVVMNQGRVEDQGPPERLYTQPATRFSATCLGDCTLLDGKVLDFGMDEVKIGTVLGPIAVTGFGEPGFDIAVAVRPEHLGLDAAPGTVDLGDAVVTEIVFEGSMKRLVAVPVRNRGVSFVVLVAGSRNVAVGDMVRLHCRTASLTLLSR